MTYLKRNAGAGAYITLLAVLAKTFLLLLGLGWLVLFVFRLALIAVLVDHSGRLAGGVTARL